MSVCFPPYTLLTVLLDIRIFFHYVVVKVNLSLTIFYIAVVMHILKVCVMMNDTTHSPSR